jgi:two-component system response regulator FlrC
VVLNPGPLLTEKDLHWLLDPAQLEGLPEDPLETEPEAEPAALAPMALAAVQAAADSGIRIGDPAVPLQEVPLGTLVALPLGLSLPELERFWLLSTLSALEGNRTHCSQKLDIALRTVRNKINEYRAAGFSIPGSGHGRDD